MSRALNIESKLDDVTAVCLKQGVAISSIEKLPGGFVRVVLKNADAAAIIRQKFGKKVVDTPVARTPLWLGSKRAA